MAWYVGLFCTGTVCLGGAVQSMFKFKILGHRRFGFEFLAELVTLLVHLYISYTQEPLPKNN